MIGSALGLVGWVSVYCDIETPALVVVTLSGIWCDRVSVTADWLDVSRLRLDEILGLICSFYLSVVGWTVV